MPLRKANIFCGICIVPPDVPENASMSDEVRCPECAQTDTVSRVLSAPFIPEATAKMLSAMNTLDTEWPSDMKSALSALPEGHAFTVPDVLFAKISDDDREDWQTRFSGIRDS